MSEGPVIEVFSDHFTERFDTNQLAELQSGWQKVALLLSQIGKGTIADLSLIEISLLPDAAMIEVHREFLSDPTATDVITFEHGELLIGVEVAQRQALEYEHDFLSEIALYGIHGMLHLAGFDDRQQADFEQMKARQEELLAAYFSLKK